MLAILLTAAWGVCLFIHLNDIAKHNEVIMERTILSIKDQVSGFMESRLITMRRISRLNSVVIHDLEVMKKDFAAFRGDGLGHLSDLAYVNIHGLVELSTQGSNRDIPDRKHFQEALTGRENISDIIWGQPYDEPLVIISVPVRGDDGVIKGVVSGAIRLTAINEIISSSQIGTTDEIYLVDRAGYIITPPRISDDTLTGPHSGKIINTEGFRLASVGETGVKSYRNYRDQQVIGAYTWIPQRQWAILAEIEEEELPFQVWRDIGPSIGAVIIAALISLVLGKLPSRKYIGPLKVLAADTDKLNPKELAESRIYQLKRHLGMERLVGQISGRLANCEAEDIGIEIEIGLSGIGEYFGFSSCSIYRYVPEKGLARQSYLWCMEVDLYNMIAQLPPLASSEFPWAAEKLLGFENIYIKDISRLPAAACREQELLKLLGLRSIALVPMSYNNEFLGFLALGNTTLNSTWVEKQRTLLGLLSELFAMAIVKRDTIFRLRYSEATNRALVEAVPHLFFRVSKDGVYLDGKIGNRKSFFPQDQYVGRHVSEVLPAAVAESALTAIKAAIKEGIAQTMKYDIDVQGTPRVREARVIAINDQEVIVVVRDITKRRRANRQLAEARNKVANLQKIASIGAMAGKIVHEINQPLNSIKVSASGLRYLHNKGIVIDPNQVQNVLTRIVREVDRIDGIIKKTRRLAHDGLVQKEPLRIDDVIESVLTMLRDDNQFQGVKIFYRPSPEEDWIEGDKLQLEQVLLNLLFNAAQALKSCGQLHMEIGIIVEVSDTVLLSVTDNGPGLPSDIPENLFEPFVTDRKGEGNMGLGLSVAKSIISAHGGNITAANSENGAIIRVELPRMERTLKW